MTLDEKADAVKALNAKIKAINDSIEFPELDAFDSLSLLSEWLYCPHLAAETIYFSIWRRGWAVGEAAKIDRYGEIINYGAYGPECYYLSKVIKEYCK